MTDRRRRPIDMGQPMRRGVMWLIGMLLGSLTIVAVGTEIDAPDSLIGGLLLALGLITIYNIRRIWREHRGE